MDKYLKTCHAFWFECAKFSTKSAFNVFTGIAAVLGLILFIIALFIPERSSTLNTLAWAIPCGVFVAAFIVNMARWPHMAYKTKADKVEEFSKQELDLVVLPNDDSYLRFRTDGDTLVGRVGIKALGERTVEDVGVTLTAIDDTLNSYRDSYLNPADCQREQSATFNVHRGDITKFVEVFTWSKRNPSDSIGICYHHNYQNYLILDDARKSPFLLSNTIDIKENRKHVLTLCVTGKDAPSKTRRFMVEVLEGDLIWIHENNNLD